MITSAAGKLAALSEKQNVARKTTSLANRKIWLPKLLYDVIPCFYLTSGIAAFLATLYISEWFWVLPHYLMFSAACVHLGIFVYRRRRSARQDASNPEDS